MYVVHGSNNRDTRGGVLYAVETHCLCELLNRYVIITKHAIVSALLFSQSEQKVKSGICTINHKTCTKGCEKKVCAFSIFVKTTQQIIPWRKRFLWKLHKKNAALYILHYKHGRGCRLRFSGNLLYCDCTDEARNTRKGDRMKTEWTGRNAQGVHVGSIAAAGAKG